MERRKINRPKISFIAVDGEIIYEAESWFWVCISGFQDLGWEPFHITTLGTFRPQNAKQYFGEYKNAVAAAEKWKALLPADEATVPTTIKEAVDYLLPRFRGNNVSNALFENGITTAKGFVAWCERENHALHISLELNLWKMYEEDNITTWTPLAKALKKAGNLNTYHPYETVPELLTRVWETL